ncbi:PP2C family protein-serine/threonine phosphatase [Nocardioides halotolerans]|uniref:PP2C family protein-serine/threonine phosphatase n=1 Tax=Nocardioides halotolerans TaxID=433660 RepID=UPI00146CD6A9|nr:protein phosphatase 2C domain-containing protein [Nocardioides halotolerans]
MSDVGRVRPHNEDSAFVGPYVAVVADGVGGAAAGEIASATAAYSASAVALGRRGQRPERVLEEAYAAAADGVRTGVQRDLDRLGMATTLTMVVTDGRSVALGHVGDSRGYTFRDGELRQVTTDHTYVQHLVETGRLDPEARTTHPWRNVVLRSVDGDPEGGGLDVVPLDVEVGDRLLLASDGLTDLVPDDVIAEVLAVEEGDLAVATLTRLALEAGGRDNVTVVVADLIDGPPVVGDGKVLGALANPHNVVDPAAVHLPRVG